MGMYVYTYMKKKKLRDLRITVGGNGNREANFYIASLRDLAQEPVLDTQRLSSSLQAPANIFLIIHTLQTLSQLRQPTAACARSHGVLPGGEPNTRDCLGFHTAAWHGCFA